MKLAANTISREEHARLMAEFEASRVRMLTVEFWGDRGSVFFEDAGSGRRKFELAGVRYVRSPVNKVLQYLGGLSAFCGVLALVLEWRMRRTSAVIANELK